MTKRELQSKVQELICKKLTNYASIEFYCEDVSNVPDDRLYYSTSSSWTPGATRISFKYTVDDENDLDNVNLSLDHSSIGKDCSLTDIYSILDAVNKVTYRDNKLVLAVNENSLLRNEGINQMISIKPAGYRPSMTNEIEADQSLLTRLYNAYTQDALSIINTSKIDKIDKKYKAFLLSRNPIHINKDWYAILDNVDE